MAMLHSNTSANECPTNEFFS